MASGFLHFGHSDSATVRMSPHAASDHSKRPQAPIPNRPLPQTQTKRLKYPQSKIRQAMPYWQLNAKNMPATVPQKAFEPERVKLQPPDTSHVLPAAARPVSSANAAKASTGNSTAATDKPGAKDSSAMQATTTIASNQPPASLPVQPAVDSKVQVHPLDSLSQSSPRRNPWRRVSPGPVPSSAAVLNALHSYEDAYASMDTSELQKIWPSLSKGQLKKLKEGFRDAQAVKVTLQDCGAPTLSKATAQVKCFLSRWSLYPWGKETTAPEQLHRDSAQEIGERELVGGQSAILRIFLGRSLYAKRNLHAISR